LKIASVAQSALLDLAHTQAWRGHEQQHERGHGRLQQQAARRRRRSQARVQQAVERRDAHQAEQQDDAPVPAQRRAFGGHALQRERPDQAQRARPAHEGERERRDRIAHRATDDRVARPQRHHDAQHRVGERRVGAAAAMGKAGHPRDSGETRRLARP
jgi:hypothetical protein